MKKTFRFLSVVLLSTLTGVSAWATTYVIPTPTFSELTSGDTCYLYNIGQKMFFNKGEAYGTQAVVDHTYSGALLIIANKQADDTYKIFTGAKNALKPESNSVLFRVASENAAGPKATFADGNVDERGRWNIVDLGNKVYTIQTPSTSSAAGYEYVATEFLGVQLNHASNFATEKQEGITYGLYYDITYSDNPANCQWAFVSKEQYQVFAAKGILKIALEKAEAKGVDVTSAVTVFNNTSCTVAEVEAVTTALNNAVADLVTPDNPEDVTNLVTNPTFDTGIKGWTSTTKAQNNGTATNQAGAFTGRYYENWNPKPYTGKMFQKIKRLPNGVYQVGIAAFVQTFDKNNATNKKQYVYANNDKTYLTKGEPTAYTILTSVEADTLEIGLAQDSTITRWMGLDNVTLKYYGNSLVSYQYLAQMVNAELNAIDPDDVYAENYADDVRTQTATAASATTKDDAFKAYKKAANAMAELKKNIAAYAKLKTEIDAKDALYWDKYSHYPPLGTAIEAARQVYDTHTATTELVEAEITKMTEALEAAIRSIVAPNSDVTALIKNANFTEDGTPDGFGSWKVETSYMGSDGTVNTGNGVAEAWNTDFNIYQDLTGVQNGVYLLTVKGFERLDNGGENGGNAWKRWNEANGQNTGDNEIKSAFYLGRNEVLMHNIFEGALPAKLGEGSQILDGDGKYTPNDKVSAAAYFANGNDYETKVYGIAVEGKLRIGIKSFEKNAGVAQWTLWSPLKLTYIGKEASNLTPVLQNVTASAQTLAEKAMYGTHKSALNTAVANATNATTGSDVNAMFTAYAALVKAMEDADTSIPAYVSLDSAKTALTDAINTYSATASTTALNEAKDMQNTLTAAISAGTLNVTEALAKVNEVKVLINNLKKPAGVASDDNPLDYTALLINPGFTDGQKGWTVKKIAGDGSTGVANNVMEGYNCDFDIYQDITNLPEGTYKIVANGFYRYGGSELANKAFEGDSTVYNAKLYANRDSANIMSIVAVNDIAKTAGTGSWREYIDSVSVAGVKTTYYYPNDRATAAERFESGLYVNTVYAYVDATGLLRIGFANKHHKSNDWTTATNFKLYYLGTESSKENTTGIKEVELNGEIIVTEYFNIDGTRTNAHSRGLKIVRYTMHNGKQVTKKIIVR